METPEQVTLTGTENALAPLYKLADQLIIDIVHCVR
jgi:hypothetical protein